MDPEPLTLRSAPDHSLPAKWQVFMVYGLMVTLLLYGALAYPAARWWFMVFGLSFLAFGVHEVVFWTVRTVTIDPRSQAVVCQDSSRFQTTQRLIPFDHVTESFLLESANYSDDGDSGVRSYCVALRSRSEDILQISQWSQNSAAVATRREVVRRLGK